MNKKELITNFFFPPRCPYCNEVIPTKAVFCQKCYEKNLIDFDDHICLLWYDKKTQGVALNIKKIWDSVEINFLSKELSAKIHSKYNKSYFNAISYVPGLKEKTQARDLAELVSQELNIPLIDALNCNNNIKQHFLNAEKRHENVLKKFTKKENVNVFGKILLLDDIITTGSTLTRCKNLLIEQGAREVVTASIFKTKWEDK